MALLSAQKIAQIAQKAGFSGESLKVAVAVALAESGGNTRAIGTNGPTQGCPNGSKDRGLWQINNCYHPDVSDQCAFNPDCNAKAAYQISNQGSNFHPWSTFLNGMYLQHLQEAEQVVATLTTQTQTQTQNPSPPSKVVPTLPSVPCHYHVKVGDTLYGIAKKFYGNGDRWTDLYNANIGVIGDNPNVIVPNEVLLIP